MSEVAILVFADTNILFSAFYGSINAGKIVEAHLSNKIELVISQKVLEDLVRNVRKKEPSAFNPLRQFLESTPPKIVKDPTSIVMKIKKLVDPKDQIIFQAAVNSKVKYFVTGNTKDYAVSNLQKIYKIAILTPSEAVQKLGL